MVIKKRVKSHVLETVIGILMAIFGLSAIFIFFNFMRDSAAGSTDLAIIEILLIVVLAILAQTIVLIRIYEQHE